MSTTALDTALAVAAALDRLNAEYLMVGSMAANYYSIPRSTKDADFVVEMTRTPVELLFAELRPRFTVDPQIVFETVTGATRYILHDSKSPFEVDVFELGTDEHNRQRFLRKKSVVLSGQRVWIPAVEDVLITKLRWAKHAFREKDKGDIRDILSVQGDQIDWKHLYIWCDRHGTRDLLEEIRRTALPS